METIKDFFRNLFSSNKVSTNQQYEVKAKLSMLMSDLSRVETAPITLIVHAKNMAEAKKKMQAYVLGKTTVPMVSIELMQSIKTNKK